MGDFVVIGTLLFGTGLLYELKVSKSEHRIAIGIVLVLTVLCLWAELAK